MWSIFQWSVSVFIIRNLLYKNYAYGDGTFLRKEVKLVSVRHNLWFSCIKMPVFETHLKVINSCFLYIQQIVTRNKFAEFWRWKLETLDLLTVKENLYMNLLWTIIYYLVNKIYYYIVILFLCYVFPFASEDFVFPLLRWIILDFEIERI